MSFILLCYTKETSFSNPGYTPSQGIISVGAYLESKGLEVKYNDSRIHSLGYFINQLTRRPMVAGFSVMSGRQVTSAIKYTKYIKKLYPDTPVVWGGVFPTMLPKEVLSSTPADYIVIGEGEETIYELCLYVSGQNHKNGIECIKGIGYRMADKIFINQRRPFLDIENLPFPQSERALSIFKSFFAAERGFKREQMGYEISRGCSHRCTFCYNNFYFGNTVRMKSLKKIRQELMIIKGFGVSFIEIYDNTLFGGDIDKIYELSEILRELNFAWCANVRFDMIDKDLVENMVLSGCKLILVGLESLDDNVLLSLKKNIDRKQIMNGINILRSVQIRVIYSIIIGLPFNRGEKIEDIISFADMLDRTNPLAEIQIQLFIPLPNTPLWETSIDYGYKPPKTLRGWIQYTQLSLEHQRTRKSKLLAKVHITSFLAYRYKFSMHSTSFFSNLFLYPFHALSKWRIKKRFYKLYFEIYILYLMNFIIYISTAGCHINVNKTQS
jgi:radical SAM superfamily enzyme YgiQ (UPF0313 family)